jgi:hypothetical protein
MESRQPPAEVQTTISQREIIMLAKYIEIPGSHRDSPKGLAAIDRLTPQRTSSRLRSASI